MNDLVKFWRDCDLERPPYIHPLDKAAVGARFNKLFDEQVKTPTEFVAGPRFGNFKDNRFHLSLLPVPFMGCLDRAEIFILLLNPGFGFGSYEEDADPEKAEMLRRSVRQELDGVEFPFVSLNPQFSWTAGFRWWEGKLRSVIRAHAAERQSNYLASLQAFASRLACIELVAYRSAQFGGGSIAQKLPSCRAARQFVESVLLPRAQKGEIKLIVTRQVRQWGLNSGDHVVLYEGGLTRGAPLGPTTPGGKAILAQMKKSF